MSSVFFGNLLRPFFWLAVAAVSIYLIKKLPIAWQKVFFYKFWDTPLSPFNGQFDKINTQENTEKYPDQERLTHQSDQ